MLDVHHGAKATSLLDVRKRKVPQTVRARRFKVVVELRLDRQY